MTEHEHVCDGCDGGICVLCGACHHEECAPVDDRICRRFGCTEEHGVPCEKGTT